MTTAVLSPPLPARGQGSSRPSTLPPVSHRPGTEFGGDALKTGRVTGALVQCPKLCWYISQIAENEPQALFRRDSFSAIRGGKPPDNVQFEELLKNCG